MMRSIQYSAVLSILCLSLCSCGGSSGSGFSTKRPSDTSASNNYRKKCGIREIKKHWHFYGREFDEEKWSGQSRLLRKVVKRTPTGNSILWEEDYYYSGKKHVWPNGGGAIDEQLNIHYDYADDMFYLAYIGQDKKILKIIDQMQIEQNGHKGKDNRETLSFADRVLKIWKNKRL